MANIAIFRINYKSDFILTLNSDAGWMTPFCIKFWTGAPSQAYFVGFDGTTYTHCALVDGEPTKLRVQFDDHHLPIGDLKFQIGYHFTVADFPASVEDEVINQASVIIEQDGEPAQVMLDFTGETAPEIEFSLPAYANEAQRIANEEVRIAAEQQRIANEDARIQAEETRQYNEQQRIQHEEYRVSEFARLKSESEAATTAANAAATLANEKAQLAADKAALAQEAATLANEKAQLAADKAALAAAAATLANDKAALAQQKAAYAQEQGDYAKAQGDYAKAQGDTAQADHERAEADHTTAAADHTTAAADHTTATSDHSRAESDHTTAASDHSRAESNHTTASSDHTRAESDHTTAASDHTRAESDHTIAAADHTTAQADHTRAESDHAAVEVYVDSLGVFDLSKHNAVGGVLATYADLSAALTALNALDSKYKYGGMSFKFVRSSDNKYIQARCMAQNFTTDVANWQGVDDEPTARSVNLVKSGSLYPIYSKVQTQTTHGEGSDEKILITDNENQTVVEITEDYVDAKNLKSNGVPVLTEHQDISGKQDKIDEIITQTVLTNDEEIEIDTDEDETIVKIGSYGIKAKDFYDLSNRNLIELLDSVNSRTENLTIDGIKTVGSNTNCPIVVFIYDDNPTEDSTLIEMLDTRNLKGTIATVGNVNGLSPTNSLGVKLQNWHKNGHGTIGHGVTANAGISGVGNGLDTMCDEDCYKAIIANNRYLDYFGLTHRGIAYFNTWEYNPHTVSIVGQYYDYGFIFGGSGFNSPDTDRYKLTRYVTDNSAMLSGAKALVDSSLGHNCIIAFGGHMKRTGKGGNYSTMEDFEELLNYIAEKVSNHQLISLNSDAAFELFEARCSTLGGIKSDKQYIPAKGQYYLGESGIEVCTNKGNLAVFDIAFSGNVSSGTIRISNISTSQIVDRDKTIVDYLEVAIVDETTIEEVISVFLKSIYREYTAVAISNNTIRLYSNITKAMNIPQVVNNTTDMVISITQVSQGVAASWL